jgi:hypothetical protein
MKVQGQVTNALLPYSRLALQSGTSRSRKIKDIAET